MSYPSISCEPKEYAGCPITHPSIVASIKNMVKQGKKTEEIMRVVGMPMEVIRKYQRAHEQEVLKKQWEEKTKK